MNDLAKILGIDEAKVNIKSINDHAISFYIQTDIKPHSCPNCNALTSKVHDYRIQKIKDITANVKNSAIGVKDNMASAVIKKAVRSLNKQNYPLDKVMDMVKAAYNESVTINNGKRSLNESLFKHALKRQVRRYHHLNG